jgi:hypothetical protein
VSVAKLSLEDWMMLQLAKSAPQTPWKAAFPGFYARSDLFLSNLKGSATATTVYRT